MSSTCLSSVKWTATERYAERATYTLHVEQRRVRRSRTSGRYRATLNPCIATMPGAVEHGRCGPQSSRHWPRINDTGRRCEEMLVCAMKRSQVGLLLVASFTIDLIAMPPPRDPRGSADAQRPSAVEAITTPSPRQCADTPSIAALLEVHRRWTPQCRSKPWAGRPALGTAAIAEREGRLRSGRRMKSTTLKLPRFAAGRRCARGEGVLARSCAGTATGEETAGRNQCADRAGQNSTGCGASAAARARSMARAGRELSCVQEECGARPYRAGGHAPRAR